MQKSLMTISIIASFSLSAVAAEHEHEHISLHYQGKPATKQTIEVNKATAAPLTLPIKKPLKRFRRILSPNSMNLRQRFYGPISALLAIKLLTQLTRHCIVRPS